MTTISTPEPNHQNVKHHCIIRILTLAFIAQVYMSLNLWFPTDRSYPTIPLLSGLGIEFGELLTTLISSLFIGNLILSSIYAKFQKHGLSAALFFFFVLLLDDVNRFQAWSYIYIVLLGIICWSLWEKQTTKTWASLQFVMAMVYFWTGIQKLNIQFITDVYPWLVKVYSITQGLAVYPLLGYGVGLFEILVGILLLSNKWQSIGFKLGIFLHVVILLVLVKDQWNSVVYPWNVTMIVLLIALFKIKSQQTTYKRLIPHSFVLVLFGFVPFLDLFNLAPHCLALGMYSGTSVECDLIINNTGKGDCIPKKLYDNLLFKSDNQSILALDDWGVDDLNIPPFASSHVYRAVAKEFCACSINYGGYIELYYPQRWKDEDTVIKVTCEELINSK